MKIRFLTSLLVSSALAVATTATAQSGAFNASSVENSVKGETFLQGENEYVIMPDLVGVIQKFQLGKGFEQNVKAPTEKRKNLSTSAQAAVYSAGGFEIYKSTTLNSGLSTDDLSQKAKPVKYKVVLRKVTNSETREVTYKPGFLTGNVIVKAKDTQSIETNLKLKQSFKDAGFYIYTLPTQESINTVLTELNKNPAVETARVEILENIKVPM